MTASPRRIGLVFGLTCMIWGTTFVALKIGLNGTPPIFGSALRHLLGSIILFGVVRYRHLVVPMTSLAVKQYLMVGLLNFSLSYSLTYSGTQFIYSNVSALLWSTIPITTAILAHFTLTDEHLTLMKGGGILVGFCGVTLIFAGYGFGQSQNLSLGMSLVLLAVLAGTWPAIYVKRSGNHPNPIVLNAVATAIGGSVSLVVALIFEDTASMVWNQTTIGVIVYLAIFGTAIAWVAYYYLLQYIEVVQVSFIGFIAPIIATFVGVIVLGEKLSPVVYLGAFLVLFGIYLTDYKRYRALLIRS
ncbi:DMT family transporter [Candidatus Neomarinimicrobiota bacterium]